MSELGIATFVIGLFIIFLRMAWITVKKRDLVGIIGFAAISVGLALGFIVS